MTNSNSTSTSTITAIASLQSKLQGLDEFITSQLEQWNGVGTAVAIVHKDQVVWNKGYGYRDLEAGLEVTPDTLFAIGSSTKSFTAAAAAQLVDEGLLDWDVPVKTYLPEFKMCDSVATERLTIRDMLCHRSGLPRHEMVWYNSPRSREELVFNLRHLEPNQDFRNKWQYQNIVYMAAGYLIGHLKGTSWEQVVQETLFNPLEMNASLFSVEKMQQQSNYAFPYTNQGEQKVRIPFRSVNAIGPSGSINSNLTDMTAWLQFQVQQGIWKGKTLVSKEQMTEMHSPQMACESPFLSKELPISAYGLGWIIEPYRGHSMIHHGGAIDGFASQVALLPDEEIGIVVLSNTNGSVIPYTVAFYIMDRLLGLEPTDWTSTFLGLMGQGEHAEVEEHVDQQQQKDQHEESPSVQHLDRPVSVYTGVYNHPGYGDLLVHETDDGLQTRLNDIDMPLQYVGKDCFSVSLAHFGWNLDCTFKVNEEQVASSVSVPFVLEPNANPIVFTRLPESEKK
ncbi:CubicO group peptidase (beta-lactamase class C family) [Paenibacillus sp. 4624]|uniref:serine hydrolase n=1 Tax=Paenibacillus sp. 4624 TaxID=3156453 RepID=UPI003D200972